MAEKLGYRDLFVEKNYLKNFAAGTINRFGDSIDALAFSWMVYEITGDRAWSAIVFGLNALPTILLMPFAGVFVEKYNKKMVMVIADVGRAVLVAITSILYMLGLVTPLVLGCFTFLMSTFEAFRIPAGLGLYPQIVPREKYTLATSFSQSVSSVSQILGTAAFGVVVATMGLQGAMFINAATFLISACFVYSIRVPVIKNTELKLNVRNFFAQMKEGFGYFYKKKIIFMVCIVGALIGVLTVPFSALNTPYIRESLGLGEMALSTQSIASIVGLMVGTALFPYINRKVSKSKLFIIGGFTTALTHFAYVLLSYVQGALVYPLLAIITFFFGLGSSFLSVVVNVAFMEQVETQYLSRVGSIFNAMASALTPLASFATAGIAVLLTVNQIYTVFGVLVTALFVILAANKLFRAIDKPVAVNGQEKV